MSSARGSGDDAEQRSDGELEARVEPWLELLPAPCVHADFAAPSAFAVADEQRPAPLVEVSFAERERFLDALTCPPEDHDEPSQALPVWAVAGCAHHGDNLLNLRRIGRVTMAFVAGRAPRMKPRHRRRRTTPTGAVEQRL